MKKKQARAVVEKVLRNYKTKLGLARHYGKPRKRTDPFYYAYEKQQRKVKKYKEIIEAIETLLMEEK